VGTSQGRECSCIRCFSPIALSGKLLPHLFKRSGSQLTQVLRISFANMCIKIYIRYLKTSLMLKETIIISIEVGGYLRELNAFIISYTPTKLTFERSLC
jgi:hypothetical protein